MKNKVLMAIFKPMQLDGFEIKIALHNKEGEQEFVGFMLESDKDNYYAPIFSGELTRGHLLGIRNFINKALIKLDEKEVKHD
jgi:hypothetical protein